MIDWTKEQEEVLNYEGQCVINAFAGTGKTTTLVEKYKRLKEKFTPEEIIFSSFTNNAVRDIYRKLDIEPMSISTIATLHRIAYNLLIEDNNFEKVGYEKKPNYFEIDDVSEFIDRTFRTEKTLKTKYEDEKPLFNEILNEDLYEVLGINIKEDQIEEKYLLELEKKCSLLFNFLENVGVIPCSKEIPSIKRVLLKYYRMTPDGNIVVLDESYNDYLINEFEFKFFLNRCDLFKKLREEKNKLLLSEVFTLAKNLLSDKDIRKKYQDKYKVIIIDEAQDMNLPQNEFIDFLENKNLILCGDFAQCIYEWRGARPLDFYNRLKQDHFKSFYLTISHRCPKNIVPYVNRIFNTMENSKPEFEFKSEKPEGEIEIYNYKELEDENFFSGLENQIDNLKKKGYTLNDIAILSYRKIFLHELKKWFDRKQIPARILEQVVGYKNRKYFKYIKHFFIIKYFDDEAQAIESLRLTLPNIIPRMGTKKWEKIETKLLETKTGLLSQKKNLLTRLQDIIRSDFPIHLNDFIVFQEVLNKITSFNVDFVKSYSNIEEFKKPANQVFRDMNKFYSFVVFMIDFLQKLDFNLIKFDDFLEKIDIELLKQYSDSGGEENIKLSTFHGAKGLEWKNVILFNISKGVFPHGNNPDYLEEQKRVFYVAITRAMENLYFYVFDNKRVRTMDGDYALKPTGPSQFIIDYFPEKNCGVNLR